MADYYNPYDAKSIMAIIKWLHIDKYHFCGLSSRFPPVYRNGVVPLVRLRLDNRVSEIIVDELSLIWRWYFKDATHKYAILVLGLDEWVLLIYGKRIDAYEKSLEFRLRLPLSPFKHDCLNYFS